MREIKFRAWNTKINRMIDVYKIHRRVALPSMINDEVSKEDYILMQYTGLKDKNGREIYEGDILNHDLWGITSIIWEHGMFRGTNNKGWNDMIDVTLADHQLQRCRIIGNIYENPTLLHP